MPPGAFTDRRERLSRLEAQEGAALEDRLCQLLCRQHLARRVRWSDLRTCCIPEVEGARPDLNEVVVTQSNLKDSVQIQQMRQLVDQGVDAIIVCCSNATALNQTIKYAYDKGVPVFSLTGYLTSPYAINVSVNYRVGGYEIGKGMAEEIDGKGNVLVVQGIPGTSGSDAGSRRQGGPRRISGRQDRRRRRRQWTDQVAQGEVQKLAGHAFRAARRHRGAVGGGNRRAARPACSPAGR